MPSQVITSVENNFIKGLITEFTGLNFPENAATDTDNCEFTIVGDVVRRLGIDIEDVTGITTGTTSVGKNSYVWNNVGGDGATKVLVRSSGSSLIFYVISTATNAAPVSKQRLGSIVSILPYVASGAVFDTTLECTFSDGNGYLFVYHPSCDPIYCTYNAGVITANVITVQIRDFTGVPETTPVSSRPTSLSNEHLYNLKNQGWAKNPPWNTFSSTGITSNLGTQVFLVDAGLTVTNGDNATIYITQDATPGGILVPAGSPVMTGVVTGYTGSTLTINVTTIIPLFVGAGFAHWQIQSSSDYITAWHTAIGNYPSNADVWWYFKNSSNVFDPTTTVNNVTLASTPAPKGHYILNAFNQQRDLLSTVSVTDILTTVRPKIGTWFQGRVWFAGVDAQQPATGDAAYYSWTENIYFSQIVHTPADFGSCYQTNDPTSETLFDLLPTDGGVIQIQGCGSVYRLFPIQNGMLVFAANGIWFITGSQGIGFSANDYTITKISQVQTISSTSFVNVNGLPYFWNEEGIYTVSPSQQGGLTVEPITVGTILSFFNSIPKNSKQFVRGAYHPIDYVIQWTYRSTPETGIVDRYNLDSILNYNTYNKAFFPYSISNSSNSSFIEGVNYISYPQIGNDTPDPSFKYPMHYTASFTTQLGIAEETDETYVDWNSFGGVNFDSFFVTGYKLHGQGQRRFQIPYIYFYSRSDIPTSYKIQGLWDYALTGDTGRWSTAQLINNWSPNFGVVFRRHKIRGRGLVLQLKVSSVDGQPFDIIGWSTFETQNTGI